MHLANLLSGLSHSEDPDGTVDPKWWTKVEEFETTAGLDDIDSCLLQSAHDAMMLLAVLNVSVA